MNCELAFIVVEIRYIYKVEGIETICALKRLWTGFSFKVVKRLMETDRNYKRFTFLSVEVDNKMTENEAQLTTQIKNLVSRNFRSQKPHAVMLPVKKNALQD